MDQPIQDVLPGKSCICRH